MISSEKVPGNPNHVDHHHDVVDIDDVDVVVGSEQIEIPVITKTKGQHRHDDTKNDSNEKKSTVSEMGGMGMGGMGVSSGDGSDGSGGGIAGGIGSNSAYRKVEKRFRIHYMEDPSSKKKKKKKKNLIPAPDPSFDDDVIDFCKLKGLSKQSIGNVHVIRHDMSSFLNGNQEYKKAQQLVKSCVEIEIPKMDEWNVYGLEEYPGFYFITGLFNPNQQLYWIKQCLEEYPQPPNITNLNLHYGVCKDVWKNAILEEQTTREISSSSSSLINSSLSVEGYQQINNCNDGNHSTVEYHKQLLGKMKWCTLGYQYDWTNRKYYKENKVPFPNDIGSVISLIASVLGYGPYEPEAAIINFYSGEQTMGGHKDDAEYALEKPIVSISFGNECIFLLGGEDRNIEPVPIKIRSGDVMIMGGRARTCFHGVARICHNTLPTFLQSQNAPQEFKRHCQYLEQNRRINLNVRQVF